ncbi:hypothetical protein AnigIFM62618_009847 [Aspergillus niger]|nr:hypothetical protein AnigIFM62618_009847 [Aspergillus niger]
MTGEDTTRPGFSGQFYAGTGKQYNIGHITDDAHILSTLHIARSACYNSREREHDSFCLEGTRVDLLKDIAEWIDTNHDEGIFWLSGMAGTGKSTIARTVARDFDHKSRLAASFLFSEVRKDSDASNADFFASTVACQLANFDPSMKDAIQETLRRYPLLPSQGLSEQWRRLVQEPLAAFVRGSDQRSLLIAIDGLDLCQVKDDQRLIIRLLFGITQHCENKVLILLASRPESAVRSALSGIQHRKLKLQDIDRKIVDSDINLFMDHEIGNIVAPFDVEWPWYGEIIAKNLVDAADGLFFWAATACQYIRDARTPILIQQRLKNISGGCTPVKGSPTERLYRIYASVLDASVSDAWDGAEKAAYLDSLWRIIGVLVYSFSDWTRASPGQLLNMDEETDSLLDDLHSIVNVPDDPDRPIDFVHPSFKDFVQERKHRAFPWTPEQSHRMLADWCLRLLNEACGQDGYKPGDIDQNGTESKPSQSVPQTLQRKIENRTRGA